VIARTWLAVGVGTLIFAMSTWFGFLAGVDSVVVAVLIVAVGVVLACCSVAAFSQAPEPLRVGLRSAMYGLGVGGVMLVLAWVADSGVLVMLAPLVAMGVGGAFGLAPVGDKTRTLARLAAVIPVTLLGGVVHGADPLVFGIFMPLTPLISVGFADRLCDGGGEDPRKHPELP